MDVAGTFKRWLRLERDDVSVVVVAVSASLLFILVSIICMFALQNATVVTVKLLSFRVRGSLSMILITSACVGALSMNAFWLPAYFSLHSETRKLRARLRTVERQLQQYEDVASNVYVPTDMKSIFAMRASAPQTAMQHLPTELKRNTARARTSRPSSSSESDAS